MTPAVVLNFLQPDHSRRSFTPVGERRRTLLSARPSLPNRAGNAGSFINAARNLAAAMQTPVPPERPHGSGFLFQAVR